MPNSVSHEMLFACERPLCAAVHPESLFLRSDNKKQKATRALHRMAFARLSPWALQRFRLGAHSVRVEVPVWGVMELPTVQTNEHAPTNPSASNSVFATFRSDALTDLLAGLAELHRLFRERV